MTRQPIGPKPLPDDLVRAMKTFAITNSLQGAEVPRPMTDAERIKELEARVAELEAALRPSMWVGPTGIEFSFSAPGRPLSSNPVDDSGWADTEVKYPDQ